MPSKNATTPKTNKRRRKSVEEYCTYLIEILSWKIRYSLSENRGKKFNPGPYSEYSAIEIIGKVLEPTKIAGREIDCTIYGQRDHDIRLNHPEDYDDDRHSLVGHISAGKRYCRFTGWVPASMLLPIGQMVLAKEFRYFDLMGRTLFRNEAHIHNISIIKEPEIDPELEANSA